MSGKGKELDDVTTVHHARVQQTHADYVLAQEEFARKKSLSGAPGTAVKGNTASSLAARRDREDQLRQLKKRLADPALGAQDRLALERQLRDLQGA